MGNACGPSRPKQDSRPTVILTFFEAVGYSEDSYVKTLSKLPIIEEQGPLCLDTMHSLHTADGIEFLFSFEEGIGRSTTRAYINSHYHNIRIFVSLASHSFLTGSYRPALSYHLEELASYPTLKDVRRLVIVTPPDSEPIPSTEQMLKDAQDAFQICKNPVEFRICRESKQATLEDIMETVCEWVREMSPHCGSGHKSLDAWAKVKLVAKSLPRKVLLH